MVKVVVNGGHGLGTKGKESPDGVKEWSYNNEIVKAAIAELKTYEGVQVKRADDPTGKRDVPLSERVNMANNWGADYYISYHNNALLNGGWGDHTGTETYTQTGVNSKETLDFAKAIHRGMVRAFGLRDRGMKTANFQETRTTAMPCVLTEGAFMDSTIDIKKLRDKNVLKAAGRESIKEFAKYKGLKKKAAKKPAPPKDSGTQGTVTVLVNGLWYYDKADWNAKLGQANKGEVFTVVDELTVDGSKMYKLKSGTYITAWHEYVEFKKK